MKNLLSVAVSCCLLAACTEPPHSRIAVEAPAVIELDSATPSVGDRGRLNMSWRLFGSITDASSVAEMDVGPGSFEVLQVYRDPTAWSCESPPTLVRVRMLDGEQAGLEGWLLTSGMIVSSRHGQPGS